jgi:hypothetical protein
MKILHKKLSVFNIVGVATLFGNAFLAVWMFFDINTIGIYGAYEPRIWVRIPEFAIAIFSLIYVVYLIKLLINQTRV